MPAQPAYITRNRYGTFYFRIVVPLPVRTALGLQREIRRSLKTDSQRLAIRRARQYAALFDAVFDKVSSVTNRDNYIPTEEDLLLLNEEIERSGQTDSWGAWASEPTELAQSSKSSLSDDVWRKLDEQQRWDAIAVLLNGEASRGIHAHQRETAERLYAKGRTWPFVKFSKRLPQLLYDLEPTSSDSPPIAASAPALGKAPAKPESSGPTLYELWELQREAEKRLNKKKSPSAHVDERGHARRLNILSGNRPFGTLSLEDINQLYPLTQKVKAFRGGKYRLRTHRLSQS